MSRRKITEPTPGVVASKARRLIVVEADDSQIAFAGHADIDLTGLYNANAQCGLVAILQEQCNLGDWHDVDRMQLPLWSDV